ncbi:MAG: phenylalanine--tRNA ligase subunit beta [Actinomycetaceae bacterium]|nr:phenylalanine--tRNA ligase subunit beta [Arcanobacterium sp.]MDD7505319.1 phenylalanine--tRNA ligase subunit beta [Actinomycetaceae bacterium]MDY6142956.1 phenylalanine--tRNA ligase subunit beta [Arcanobacterium sp.]
MPLIPIEWLAQHVEVPANLTASQLAADLVRVGLEEEEIHGSQVTGPIVVGKVLTRDAKEQTNGKVINYCRVDVGSHNDAPGEGKEPSDLPSRGIICGAHNFEVGDYVVVSLPGAVLPGDFQIAARKTYGHISDGMICSARELGIGEDHSGIIVLARGKSDYEQKNLPAVGEDVLPYLGIGGEVLEINITPDRGYAFSMRGVAREYSHSTGAKFTDHGLVENAPYAVPEFNNEGFAVHVNDTAPIHGKMGSDKFVTVSVRGVDPHAQSPKWMRDRLNAAGMRPISLAVDATNYVMLDLGQPLHAYDRDKLTAPIVVRRARSGESLVTLDDVKRALDPEDLLITDSLGGEGEHVIGLAGTMGGQDTEISADTRNVLVEAAHFDEVSVARMARRHRLPSEASKRFERGVDPELPEVAAYAVANLLVEYGGGEIDAANYRFDATTAREPLEFSTSETQRLTGLRLSPDTQVELLEQIGCDVERMRQDGEELLLSVTPPSWRPDLVGSAHFVEEIARLVGFDEIESIAPSAPAGNGLSVVQRQKRDIARALAEQGWVQVLSYPFVSAEVFARQGIADGDERLEAIRLKNPLQDEAPLMRTSILDSLLETARMNVSRGNGQVAIFETSVVTRPRGIEPTPAIGVGRRPSDAQIDTLMHAIPAQPYHVAGIACGEVVASAAGIDAVVWDWRDAVEAARTIAHTIGLELDVDNAQYAPFHPGRCAQLSVAGRVIGYAGELAPRVCKEFGLPKRSIAFEIDADALFDARGSEPVQVQPVAVNPAAKEDIALVVDDSVPAAKVARVIRHAAGEILEDLQLFDVYRGSQIPDGKKSLAFALRFRSLDHTLTAEETAAARKRIVKQTRKAVHAELRA